MDAKIEGTYAIVSAERSECTRDENTARLIMARAYVQAQGLRVTMVDGAWQGVAEHSLMIEGVGAANVARAVAIAFAQDTWIDVANGSAILKTASGAIVAVFTQRIAGDADNYSVINGERFSFAA